MKTKKGFSLTELLVTVSFISILASISVTSYNKYKKKSKEIWVKAELAKVASNMKSAYFLDDGYHQFLYMVGYRPKGEQEGVVAIPSRTASNKACCDNYSNIGTNPCTGGFMYYNCKNSAPNNKSSNIEICDSSDACFYDSSALSIDHASPLGGKGSKNSDCQAEELDSASKSWCDCDSFTLVGKSSVGSFFTLNDKDILCYKEKDSGYLNKITQ